MSRAETTAMLSKLVEKRLKNRVSYWASEVNFDLDSKLIDYLDDGWKIINVTAANPLALDNNEAVVLYVIEKTTAKSLEQTE